MHGPIDCVLRLVDEYDVEPEQIESISCVVLTGGRALVADPIAEKQNPTNTVDAQFSMPFGAAVAAVKRTARTGRLQSADCGRSGNSLTAAEDHLRIRRRYRRGRAGALARTGCHATRRWSGKRHEIPDPRGSESEPLGWDDLAAKFNELTTPIMSDRRRASIVESVSTLERADSVRPAWAAAQNRA